MAKLIKVKEDKLFKLFIDMKLGNKKKRQSSYVNATDLQVAINVMSEIVSQSGYVVDRIVGVEITDINKIKQIREEMTALQKQIEEGGSI